MHVLPIILATFIGFATSVPMNAGMKERIFKIPVTPSEKIAQVKELLEANDVSVRSSVIEDLLTNVIDTLRDLIINGNDDIPVLDPFTLDELYLDGELVDLPNSHLSLQNVVVNNLSTFEIDQLTVTTVSLILQRYRIELDARIPVLDAQAGNYDLSIDIFGGNIFGNGEVKIKIVNPRFKAIVVVGLRLSITGIFLYIRESNLRFDLDAFEAQISGLFDDEVASEFVSTFLSTLVPELLEFFEEDITNTLSSTFMEIANVFLEDLNLIDLLP